MKRFAALLLILPCMLSGCAGSTGSTGGTDADTPAASDTETGTQASEAADTQTSEAADTQTSETSDTQASEAADTQASETSDTQASAVVDESKWEDLMFYKVSDIDKRSMRFGDIVSQNDVTMVNVWGTFCGPCLEEMPDIEALYKKYRPQGFGVVGLTCDIAAYGDIDESVLRDALDIRSDLGITYPLLIETSELDGKFASNYVPATFFLDKNGKVIDEGYVGSLSKAEWEKAIKENLKKG
ncbi:MAG: redoxin domain-containing protein [Firmicutes bacterium]|nr:redoxin domain-containing protein [Bacillota bacterium]